MKPPVALAIPLFAVFACAALAPHLPPPERPECSDGNAAVKMADCRTRIRAARAAGNAVDVASIKAECRAFVDAWEACE